jgi:hypothetical protein
VPDTDHGPTGWTKAMEVSYCRVGPGSFERRPHGLRGLLSEDNSASDPGIVARPRSCSRSRAGRKTSISTDGPFKVATTHLPRPDWLLGNEAWRCHWSSL